MIELLNLYEGMAPRLHAEHFLYELMKERQDDPHVNISHAELPSWDAHLAFVRSVPYFHWDLIVEKNETTGERLWVGYVSATHRNEIGIIVQRQARFRGVGRDAVWLFMNKYVPLPPLASERPGRWIANINPANAASIRMFKKLGFNLIQHTYAAP